MVWLGVALVRLGMVLVWLAVALVRLGVVLVWRGVALVWRGVAWSGWVCRVYYLCLGVSWVC